MAFTEKNQRWVFNSEVDGRQTSEGVTRKVLAYCDELMCAEHAFETGATGSVHSHPHTQITYVAEGAFEFTIDGETKTVRRGDTLLKQNGVPHGCVCVEKGILVDFFTPMRETMV
ncbi:MAG: cupin domain-containing protein [Clostridiales bacterium]|jgi:quercetin dioxygenase-like cupin family protein|nr:cupin domain-containing protein [Clostridiales bacterium]